ncbi:hypothetical protein PF023_05960 [Enterococcus thailandicus]|uniref:hypothetical protein n=1 Tax=Enterococcus thailandicus TaxID=417368 RepID=UPI0022EBA5B8|nr:hypothetical protein [Enterococcus thailandicus]MDA3973582.1 hypothetical protein [Enterococcus thailandicus]MDA3975833.1 hypothetical protein [Enterococcus thailandicus]MDA3981041.1 hypothetical protein [Enterococcus thailandicus]
MFEILYNQTLTETITWLQEEKVETIGELVLFPSTDYLQKSLAATPSELTITVTEYLQMFDHYELVARTIDGDYLLANEHEVVMLPHSHIKEDFLYYYDTFSSLIIKYANSKNSIETFFKK